MIRGVQIAVASRQAVTFRPGIQLFSTRSAGLDAVVAGCVILRIGIVVAAVRAGCLATIIVAAKTCSAPVILMRSIDRILKSLVLGDAACTIDVVVTCAVGTYPSSLMPPTGLLIKIQGQPPSTGNTVIGAVPAGSSIANDSRVGYGCHG